jgi:hypothetical protein
VDTDGGGNGAPPLASIGGGNGAPPFATGGGNGAPPLAIITVPLLCAATTVFRPIAPAKMSMARSRAVSLRDIESASEAREAREHSISNYTNVKKLIL